MKTFILSLILMTAHTTLAGTISSGGMPVPAEPPPKPFAYRCEVNLSEQTAIKGKACFIEAKKNLELTSDQLVAYSTGDSFGNKLDDGAWEKVYAWEGCGDSPKNLKGHYLSLSFGRDKDNESTAELYVQVAGEQMRADSEDIEKFSAGTVSAKAGLYREYEPSSYLLLNLRATCRRVK